MIRHPQFKDLVNRYCSCFYIIYHQIGFIKKKKRKENHTPHAEYVDLISLDFQSILPWPSGISENVPLFFALNLLEIHVFSSKFRHTPWNSNNFYSTFWIFPLIFLTRKLRIFFFGKVLFISLLWPSSIYLQLHLQSSLFLQLHAFVPDGAIFIPSPA